MAKSWHFLTGEHLQKEMQVIKTGKKNFIYKDLHCNTKEKEPHLPAGDRLHHHNYLREPKWQKLDEQTAYHAQGKLLWVTTTQCNELQAAWVA